MSFEAIAIIFAILVWVISGIVKGLKWLNARLRGTKARPSLVEQAVADAQRQAVRLQAPGEPARAISPAQTISPARTSAPATRYKTSAAEFISQEQVLQAEEAAGLGVPLVSAQPLRPAKAAPLFGNTDDLVRAVILQEVLGPPLSKRQNSPTHPPV